MLVFFNAFRYVTASISFGYKKDDILEIVIASDTLTPASPCGACRQVISELMPKDAIVTMINPKLINTCQLKVSELLPYVFERDQLNEESKL